MSEKRLSLVERMRDIAPGHPRSAELLEKAYDLERAIDEFSRDGGSRRLLGAWARARLLWRQVTGEDLV